MSELTAKQQSWLRREWPMLAAVAYGGYLAIGKGTVSFEFPDPDASIDSLVVGYQALGESMSDLDYDPEQSILIQTILPDGSEYIAWLRAAEDAPLPRQCYDSGAFSVYTVPRIAAPPLQSIQ